MSLTRSASILAAAALIAKVSAHGIVQGIVADGVWSSGYIPSFSYDTTPPTVAGWTTTGDGDLGFVNDFTSPDIVCHKSATPGGAYVTVAAGDSVELQWTVWPESHKGPVIDYLASCSGDCTTVDKTALLFNKIDEGGLINGSPAPGTWASDTLISNNNSWSVTIPSEIAPGKYVLRHEIIALHQAENLNGSQLYPQCINLEITGAGTNTLTTGTIAQEFYTETEPGILVSIYYPALTNYTIPGPALIVDAVSASQPRISGSATAAASPTSAVSPAASSLATSTNKPAFSVTAPSWNSTWTSAATSGTVTSVSTISVLPVPASPSTSGSWSRSCTSSSTAAPAMTSSSASTPWPAASSANTVAPAMTSSSVSTPWPAASSASPVETSTSTSPMSFTSTLTGRIGKPTKFTCYIDED